LQFHERFPHELFEISLLLDLGLPFNAVKGPADTEFENIYGRVKHLTQKKEPSLELFLALLKIKDYYDVRLELQIALKVGHEMRALAQNLDKPELLILAKHEIGVTLFFLGQAEDFLKQQQQILNHYTAEEDASLHEKIGYDPLIDILLKTGRALWFLGYVDQSEESYQKVLSMVSKVRQPTTKANILLHFAFHYTRMREVAHGREIAEELLTLSREHGYLFGLAGALGVMGWVLGEEEELKEGINMIHSGLAILMDIDSWLTYQQHLTLLADTYCKAGKISEGLAVIEEALRMVHEKGFLLEEAEIHRINGELLLMEEGGAEEAQVCFQRAIEVARRLNAKSWELRATLSLCRLWQGQGKREQAREMLERIFDWFTEGFNTPDLTEAKSLLEALS